MQRREFVCESYRFAPDTGTLSLHYAFAGGPRFEEAHFELPLDAAFCPAAKPRRSTGCFVCCFWRAASATTRRSCRRALRCAAFPLDAARLPPSLPILSEGPRRIRFAERRRLSPGFSFAMETVEPADGLRLQPAAPHLRAGGRRQGFRSSPSSASSRPANRWCCSSSATPTDRGDDSAAGLPAIRVTRSLDPTLFALNEAGALNGHVPITGILSMIVFACAIICGFDAIAMSNEHSASAPNLVTDGREVNHQYSKSFEFEQAFCRVRRAACR